MGFTFDSGNLTKNLRDLPGKVNRQIAATVAFHATQAEASMKTEAPWNDDTGAARAGLFTATYHAGNQHTIYLSHSVHYGIWLEIRRDFHGKYRIVIPSIKKTGDLTMRSLQGMFGRMR